MCAILLSLFLGLNSAHAQTDVPFVGLGDSIGQGVQSADANAATQPYSFLSLIAWRMGAPFPLPLIRTNIFGAVGSVDGRSRYEPTVRTNNLAVSGADVHSILYDAATAADVGQIDSETELVLFPELGSQIEIAERRRPAYVACWIGNNDALGAALAFDQLDATQLTPVAEFTADFTQLVQRLDAIGAKAAFGTIPDITGIGFLVNRNDLVRFLGSHHGLPDGSLTTLPAMFLVKLGLANGTIFSDPNYVLDPKEQQIISQHIDVLNDVIRTTVAAHGMALVDTHAIFDFLSSAPLDFFGFQLTTRFLGGIFSLDGVHPSNTGHALAAYFFIDALNQHYNANIPQLDPETLYWLTVTDPHLDKDGDGRVVGRFGAGLLETLLTILNIAGDSNDTPAAAPTLVDPAAMTTSTAADTTTTSALAEYKRRTGKDLRRLSSRDRVRAMHELFGTGRGAKRGSKGH
jgi:phospholipase/lecithinase/hemolysin